jgi:hypothetical protein
VDEVTRKKSSGVFVLCARCGVRRAKKETWKLAFTGRVCRNTEACDRRKAQRPLVSVR